MSLNFWELIFKFFSEDHSQDGEIVEYEFEGLDDSRCIITAYSEGDNIIVVNLIDMDQWEMIKDIAEVTNAQVSDVVRGLGPDEVDQVRLDLSGMDLD